MMILNTSIITNAITIMLYIFYMIMVDEIQTVTTLQSSSDNILYIRHGRSRVRHSNEKDHIRWGLQAFDNLTLDYDIDEYENDTSNGNGTQQNQIINSSSSTLFGSDIWALTDNTSYFNQTSQLLYSTQQKSRGFQSISPSSSSSIDDIKNKNLQLGISSSITSSIILESSVTTQFPLFYPIPTIRKKLRKKKIMENIKKNVDKGLEYLKSHQNLDNENFKIPTSISTKYDNDYIHHQEFVGYQNDAATAAESVIVGSDGDDILLGEHLYKFNDDVNDENRKLIKKNDENNWKHVNEKHETTGVKSIADIMMPISKNNDFVKINSNPNIHQQQSKHFENNKDELSLADNRTPNPVKYIQHSRPLNNQQIPLHKTNLDFDGDVQQSVIKNINNDKNEIVVSTGNFYNKIDEKQKNVENSNFIKLPLPLEHDKYDEPNSMIGSGEGMGLGTIQNDDSDAGIFNENRFNNNNNNDFDGGIADNNNNNNNDDDSAIIEDELILANIFDGISEEDLSELDEISRNNRLNLMKGRDVVTKFLQIVETQHLLGANCKAGTALNLGEGVVDRYAQDRFRVEAEVAVNRANMLTSIFKNTSPAVQSSEHLLHASVLSMVAFDDDIFAAGHCFDWDQHPLKSGLFCPFAYRLPSPDQGASFAKDLAAEYDYLGNTSEWFFQARKNAERVIARNDQYIKAFHMYLNRTDREEDEILAVKYEDGRWSKPYYDCGGGNIWMLTYTVPFFGYDNENTTYFFKGTSGIDIDLRRVDIDQCPQRNTPGTTQPLNIFAGTDKCKQRTTMCEPIPGLGFRRGSYKCICRKGFYYPDTISSQKYFNGSILEEEYEKLMLGENSTYNKPLIYECLPCAEGCDYCEDASPCVAALNWPMRTSILVLACAVIGFLPPAAWFTFRYQQVKVVRAASPALLRVIALGAFFIYCTTIVMYPHPSLYTCTARIWLREIGFSLTYGALMLKTWRISVIFRVRSAKAVKITDAALLKRLGVICGVIGGCLLVRTIVSPPEVVVGRTADDLKAFLCKTDWWDYTFTSMEVLFLAWGVRLCIMVRKAPSEFNESRFISMAIYNEFLLTCFLNVSMLFLQSPANPDLLFIIFFCHTQLTVTLLLGLIFGSKVYIVLRSGKSQEAISMGAKSSGAKFNFRPQIRTFANPSTSTSTAQMHTADAKLSDQEALEEIRQLSVQLQRIQESAPPKGIAVMTIASLLDGLKLTTQQFTLKPPTQSVGGISSSALTLIQNNDIHKNNNKNNNHHHTSTKNNDLIITKIEKSINTSLTGEEFLRKLQENSNANVCQNCAKIILKCTEITKTSPQHKNQSENNLSFSNLQLDCMCSQSDDLDADDHQHYHVFGHTANSHNFSNCNNNNNNSNNKNNNNSNSNIESNLIVCTSNNSTVKNSTTTVPINTMSSELHNIDSIKNNSSSLIESKQSTSIRTCKHKCYSSNNLLQLQMQLNLDQENQISTKSKHSSSCDNHKFNNDDFLICDNCKNKLININSIITTNISSTSTGTTNFNVEPTFSTFSTFKPQCINNNSNNNKKSNKTNCNKNLITTTINNSELNLDSNLRLKKNIDIDELSFHSTDDSSCYNDDKNYICNNTIGLTEDSGLNDDKRSINKIDSIPADPLLNNDSSNSSKNGSGNNIATEYSSSSTGGATSGDDGGGVGGDGGGNSTNVIGSGRKVKHRKNDKLLLDLNDRSKYTKEVSV